MSKTPDWKEYSKVFYRSTKRELIGSGKTGTTKKDVYTELRKRFAKASSGDNSAVDTVAQKNLNRLEETNSRNNIQQVKKSQRPRLLTVKKITKSNLDFFEKFYKLTSSSL